jgi:hypothetical protein
MSFVHEDPEFEQLLAIVARDAGISEALTEKDYWVTHTLWALHETELEVWFQGGTSLSKGFGIINRFSEDLDLMILSGPTSGLPEVTNWTSTNKGPVARRRAFYNALADALVVPAVRVERDRSRIDKRARGADYLGHYPGVRLDQLTSAMSPFVRLEVGSARVEPSVPMPLRSFVHDYLHTQGMLGDYDENRPRSVRCVHPLVTLLEKLDAIARRYERDPMEADAFVRHYEDAAQIIRAVEKLPDTELSVVELAQDMVATNDIRALPSPDEAALQLADPDKRQTIDSAYTRIAPMFWGPRIPLDEACSEIRAWLRQQLDHAPA